ncbi:MAG: hypothetical protein V1738_05890 [Patescibacteria group bacterium]
MEDQRNSLETQQQTKPSKKLKVKWSELSRKKKILKLSIVAFLAVVILFLVNIFILGTPVEVRVFSFRCALKGGVVKTASGPAIGIMSARDLYCISPTEKTEDAGKCCQSDFECQGACLGQRYGGCEPTPRDPTPYGQGRCSAGVQIMPSETVNNY